MSKIGKKELALREQRETKRPRGHVRLAKMVEDFPKAVRESLEDAKKKCTIDHKADGAVPKELCATCNPDPKRKAPTPPKPKSEGVTLAPPLPPLAVRKAIAKDLGEDVGEETAATKLFETAAKKKLDQRAAMLPPIVKKKKAVRLPKPDPMERKLAEAVDLMATKTGRKLAVAAMKHDKIEIVGAPGNLRGAGLKRLRASPNGEKIRQTVIDEQKTATKVKKTVRKNGAAAAAFTDENVKTAAAMIKRKTGALSSELQKACKWEPVMVRRFVRDIARKKLGMSVICDRSSGKDSTYRVK